MSGIWVRSIGEIFSSPMGGGGITLFVLGGWKHLPIIGSGWVLALGIVFSGVSVALANEAPKAEDATRASWGTIQ